MPRRRRAKGISEGAETQKTEGREQKIDFRPSQEFQFHNKKLKILKSQLVKLNFQFSNDNKRSETSGKAFG